MTATTVQTVKIAELDAKRSVQVQVRVGLDEDTVKSYVHCFEQLPPITVFDIDGTLVVADGNHRVEAARRLQLKDISAMVRAGTWADAEEEAALANVRHGKPLTGTEKRNVVDRLLHIRPERADGWIAGDVGVDHKTVRARREYLESDSVREIPRLEELVRRDGKTYPRDLDVKADGPLVPRIYPSKVHTLDVMEGLSLLDTGSVDLVVTDPPYNIGVGYSGTNQDRLPDSAYHDWCAKWFAEIRRVLKDTGSFYVMHYPEVCATWKRELDRLLNFQRWITWVYPCNVGQSPTNWTRAQRTILAYTKGSAPYFDGKADPQPFRNPTDKRIKQLIEDGQEGVTPYDWWEFNLVKNVSSDKQEWPNQIPVPLVERIVKVACPPDGLVLDPFMGSGTTAVAAAQNGRSWIGFDQDPKSSDMTEARLNGGTT